jgi:hypothetical protein
MKSSIIHLWAVVIFLISSSFCPVHGLSVASLPTFFLAGLTAAGLGICEHLLRSRRPALAVVVGHSRN